MDRKIFILISVACIILTASAVAKIGDTAASDASQKIDTALADRLKGSDDKKIPVIVMLNGAASPNLDDFAVKLQVPSHSRSGWGRKPPSHQKDR